MAVHSGKVVWGLCSLGSGACGIVCIRRSKGSHLVTPKCQWECKALILPSVRRAPRVGRKEHLLSSFGPRDFR